jgi:hypothetical protein
MSAESHQTLSEAMAAFARDEAPVVRDLLSRHPELRTNLNEPVGPFDSPPIIHVRSRSMLDEGRRPCRGKAGPH